MHGKYKILVENAYIKYEFVIYRNITVIRGNSATGKTTLVEMIRAFNEQEDTGIRVKCDRPLTVIYGKDWMDQLKRISGSIVFIDEQSRFVKSREFAGLVKGSDNYFVIVTREKLSELPYSITEIYGIRTSGKYAGLAGEYTTNEFYRIYGENPFKFFKPDVIITEDSNSGYEFWKAVSGNAECISANGKTKIINKFRDPGANGNNYLAIVDGAAFGSEMEELMQYIKYYNKNAEIYAPESFEYLLLTSGIFSSGEIREKCRNTCDHADSTRYMSWEQFYTGLLTEITANTEMKYTKHKLNLYYLSERNKNLILNEVPENLGFLTTRLLI